MDIMCVDGNLLIVAVHLVASSPGLHNYYV